MVVSARYITSTNTEYFIHKAGDNDLLVFGLHFARITKLALYQSKGWINMPTVGKQRNLIRQSKLLKSFSYPLLSTHLDFKDKVCYFASL